MRLVVGLGNPGPQYAETRHNAGFRVVRKIAGRMQVAVGRRCGPAWVSDPAPWCGEDVVLVLPLTYMNLSGEALPPVFERFGAGAADLIVVTDDLALPAGKIRVRPRGSDGGHNGLKSIAAILATEDYARVRVGIGQPQEPGTDVRDFVLSPGEGESGELLQRAEELAADAVGTIISSGMEKAMAGFNGRDLRDRIEES